MRGALSEIREVRRAQKLVGQDTSVENLRRLVRARRTQLETLRDGRRTPEMGLIPAQDAARAQFAALSLTDSDDPPAAELRTELADLGQLVVSNYAIGGRLDLIDAFFEEADAVDADLWPGPERALLEAWPLRVRLNQLRTVFESGAWADEHSEELLFAADTARAIVDELSGYEVASPESANRVGMALQAASEALILTDDLEPADAALDAAITVVGRFVEQEPRLRTGLSEMRETRAGLGPLLAAKRGG